MCVGVYIQCLIHHFYFISNYIYFAEQRIVKYCLILKKKHLAYMESIENSRLSYI